MIEYVWGWMKLKVVACEPHHCDSLVAAIEEAWGDLEQTTTQHAVSHMTTVMSEIIDAEGGHSH